MPMSCHAGYTPRHLAETALKVYETFPAAVRRDMQRALTVAAEGEKADIAKPFKGVGSGVFEIALKSRGDAYRVIYVVRLTEAVYVIDAFQKKSKTGSKTPKVDVDRIRERVKRLTEKVQ